MSASIAQGRSLSHRKDCERRSKSLARENDEAAPEWTDVGAFI
jgi:hypothetical protein